MKLKFAYLIPLAAAALSLTACNYDDDQGFDATSAEKMAGEWVCAVNDGGELHTAIYTTSNTAADIAGILMLSDYQKTFRQTAVEVNCDYKAMTFSTPESGNSNKFILSNNTINEMTVIVKNGKITPGVIEVPSGTHPADKIEFTILFSNDDPAYTEIKVVGYRRTGFMEDEGFYYTEGL